MKPIRTLEIGFGTPSRRAESKRNQGCRPILKGSVQNVRAHKSAGPVLGRATSSSGRGTLEQATLCPRTACSDESERRPRVELDLRFCPKDRGTFKRLLYWARAELFKISRNKGLPERLEGTEAAPMSHSYFQQYQDGYEESTTSFVSAVLLPPPRGGERCVDATALRHDRETPSTLGEPRLESVFNSVCLRFHTRHYSPIRPVDPFRFHGESPAVHIEGGRALRVNSLY